MSRSKKKIPYFGNASGSDKEGKQKANRALRVRIKQILRINYEKELPLLREVSNVWSFNKDGKHYWRNTTPKDMRK